MAPAEAALAVERYMLSKGWRVECRAERCVEPNSFKVKVVKMEAK